MKINYKTVLFLWTLLAASVVAKDFLQSQTLDITVDKSNRSIEQSGYPFIVEVWPKDATVKIMNIGPKYVKGMILPAGNYDVKVQKSGYDTKRIWITHNVDDVNVIRLSRKD